MDESRDGLDQMTNRDSGYPLATIAYFGPDDQLATKVVVAILYTAEDEEPLLKKWFTDQEDARTDRAVLDEMLAYLTANQVHRVVMPGRIIGCPHEEGVDYPEGEACPQCPFWANRDRWTGELLD